MKSSDIIIVILVCIVFFTLGFLSGKYPILNWIRVLVWFYAIYLIISKRHTVKPRWAALMASFLLPGLGQVIYARQWVKMLILLAIILGGPVLLLIILALKFLYVAPYLVLSIIGAEVYNLIDAYKVGKKVEEIPG